jgi:uncharacterized oxidoreductase
MSFLSGNFESKSTILITGGGTGIGLALAQRFLALGHVVIAVGRRQTVLDEAAKNNPGLLTVQGDIGSDATRITLFEKVVKDFPDVNVLVNNAGFGNFGASPLKDTTADDWQSHKDVIETNLTGSIHMSILFIPHFLTKSNAMIINNTSMLAFFPIAGSGITYSLTKGL